MTDADLIATYVALLPIQWSGPGTPAAQATIALLAETAVASQIVGQVLSGFALTSIYGQTVAVGAQLDILGQFVGARRSLPNFVLSGTYFSFLDTTLPYDAGAGGFGDTTLGTPPPDLWLSTTQVPAAPYVLSDPQMVQLIQYLAAVNHADFTVEVIDEILFQTFGALVTVEETAPMQLTYTQDPSDTSPLFDIINYLHAFPHPAGVEILVVPG
jgi:hypothetical protein